MESTIHFSELEPSVLRVALNLILSLRFLWIMGAAASTTSYTYKTAEEALAAGKTQIEIDAYIAEYTAGRAEKMQDEEPAGDGAAAGGRAAATVPAETSGDTPGRVGREEEESKGDDAGEGAPAGGEAKVELSDEDKEGKASLSQASACRCSFS